MRSIQLFSLFLIVSLCIVPALCQDFSSDDSSDDSEGSFNTFNTQLFLQQQQLILGTNAVQGFNTGFNNGFNFGFNTGATNGFNLGFSNGNVNGFNFGLNNFANQFTNNFNNLFTNNLINNLGTTLNNQFGKLNFNNGLAGTVTANTNSISVAGALGVNPAQPLNTPQTFNTAPARFSAGILAAIIISGIVGGFLIGGAIVFGINYYTRQQATKTARASLSKPHNNNNNVHSANPNNIVKPQPLATGNISVGELKV